MKTLWLIIYFSSLLSHQRSKQFLSKLNPVHVKVEDISYAVNVKTITYKTVPT